MASLTDVTTPSLTVDGNTVWTQANAAPEDGTTAGLDANQLAGYDIRYFDVLNEEATTLDLTGGSTGTFYPIVFNGQSWSAGGAGRTVWMDIRRDPNDDGSNYGRLQARMRYRSTNWGYHRSFWEIVENYGNGTYYPFIAQGGNSPHRSYSVIWLRGGLTYKLHYSDPEAVLDSRTVDSKGAPGLGDGSNWSWQSNVNTASISSRTTTGVPDSATYFQLHYCSKGYDLGNTSYRWANCYVGSKDISSDKRYKTDFGVSYGMEFLNLLKPRTYQWKDGNDTRRYTGLIAQEVKEAMDSLGITEQEFAGYDGRNPDELALSYDQFVPAIINAIKDADTELKLLLSRITKLEKTRGII